MYIKNLPQVTVTDLIEQADVPKETVVVPTDQVRVSYNLQSDDSIRIGDREVPFTGAGLVALGDWLKIPSKFLDRLPTGLVPTLVNGLLADTHDEVAITLTDSGVEDAHQPNGRRIDPRSVFEIAARVVSPDAQVVDYRRNNQNYSFEVITRPTVVEEAELAVRDISHGGLRFGQEWKENLAPWVQPYIYRLICTNGMEIPDSTLAITSRGNTMEEVLASLEEMAQVAFGRVESDIQAFYDMRNVTVEHPAMVLARMGREQGISENRLMHIIEGLPEYLDENGRCTQFDLVNILTNEANNPNLVNRFQAMRTLQQAGGNIAFEHATRCGTCQSRL